jgi:acyl carrier protein phosphodiesterase
MNFLAHLYLSGNDADLMIGNFIADSVKGKSYVKFKPGIQKGILLHRKIDEFTDRHPITKELKSKMSLGYNKHSGIVIDIFYDHFLSINWDKFSSIPLDNFIESCHRNILRNIFILPSKIKAFLPFFIGKQRLKSYSRLDGIESVLKIMSKYTSLPSASDFAMEILQSNYAQFNNGFNLFFDEMIIMVNESIHQD